MYSNNLKISDTGVEEDQSKDNIYVNIIMNGPSPIYNVDPAIPPLGEGTALAEYKVTKTIPFLDKPADYYCSVIRFVVPLQTIPILIMPIIPNQGNPDLSTLLFGMSYLGTNFPRYLVYFPDNILDAPNQNQPTQVITQYYYIYSYAHMIEMFNLTLSGLWITSGLAAAFPTQNTPFFSYNSTTELITIVVPPVFVNGIAQLYINNATLNYLQAFHYSFLGLNLTNGTDFSFIFENNPNNYYPTPGVASVAPQYFQYTQEYKSLYYWNSLRSLIFSSQTLPISPEVVPANNNTGVYSSFPIITDYIISTEGAGESRSIATYNPTSQYRLVSLSGNSPIASIDIKIFWTDQLGNTYPLLIPQNQQASVKLGFFKKFLYKNTINTRK